MKIIRPVFCGFALVLILVGAAYAQQAAPAAPPVPAAPAVPVPAAAPAAPGVQSVVKKAIDSEKINKYLSEKKYKVVYISGKILNFVITA